MTDKKLCLYTLHCDLVLFVLCGSPFYFVEFKCVMFDDEEQDVLWSKGHCMEQTVR